MSSETSNPRGGSLTTRAAVVAGVALAGLAAVYGMGGLGDNAQTIDVGSQPGTAHTLETVAQPPSDKLNSGEMRAFVFRKEPQPIDAFSFVDGSEQPMSMADFKGKVVLLNLWATWCAPCRKEMPDLDRLQRDMGSDDFEVVALSLDRSGLEASQKFLDDIGIQHLKTYIDATSRASKPLRVVGMPTTILVDREGRELGRLIGPAKWDHPDAKRLIQAAIDPS